MAIIPVAAIPDSAPLSLDPKHKMIGMSGRILKMARASSAPVIFGMVMSVITRLDYGSCSGGTDLAACHRNAP